MLIWLNLLSGLIGAVIGAGATILASWFAIMKTAKMDLKRRRQQEYELKTRIIKSLEVEIEDNIKLSEEVFISHAKVPFINDAYQLSKLNAPILPPELFGIISPVYAEIAKYNAIIGYDQRISNPVSWGTFDSKFTEKNSVIKEKLFSLKNEIQKFLKE